MTMADMADAVFRRMTAGDKLAVLNGNHQRAAKCAQRVLGLNEDQAFRVAEEIVVLVKEE